jgi:hypothetical protein
MNVISVIFPFGVKGQWVFDDETAGLRPRNFRVASEREWSLA